MRAHNDPSPTSSFWWQFLSRNLSILLFLGLASTGMMSIYWYFNPATGNVEAVALGDISNFSAPIYKPVQNRPVSQRLTQSPGPIKIGLIIGHAGNDSGAVCDDGLTELTVNQAIAQKVLAQLLAAGINAEMLEEFDPRLSGYTASALISIHADSCHYVNDMATGFKISGSPYTDSSSLSICTEQAYRAATALPYHPHSITPDMENYHAFRKIAPGVPAIIIEVGFMYLDRQILTTGNDRPVQGLVNGIQCYLEQTR
jgi:N-acetylmuramoyl-L-alanine amidase